jgi:hypothetical protein
VEHVAPVWIPADMGARCLNEPRTRGARQTAQRMLDELPDDITALDALKANIQLVKMLQGRRWFVTQAARETGASWAEIGDSLDMGGHEAYDDYRITIHVHEHVAPDLYDVERAKAALGTSPEDTPEA